MSWAIPHVQDLKNGKTVKFRPIGRSMTGRIESKQLCTVEPLQDSDQLAKNDIVLCKVANTYYLHLISNISNGRYEISNNRGRVNGWITRNFIFGKVVNIEN